MKSKHPPSAVVEHVLRAPPGKSAENNASFRLVRFKKILRFSNFVEPVRMFRDKEDKKNNTWKIEDDGVERYVGKVEEGVRSSSYYVFIKNESGRVAISVEEAEEKLLKSRAGGRGIPKSFGNSGKDKDEGSTDGKEDERHEESDGDEYGDFLFVSDDDESPSNRGREGRDFDGTKSCTARVDGASEEETEKFEKGAEMMDFDDQFTDDEDLEASDAVSLPEAKSSEESASSEDSDGDEDSELKVNDDESSSEEEEQEDEYADAVIIPRLNPMEISKAEDAQTPSVTDKADGPSTLATGAESGTGKRKRDASPSSEAKKAKPSMPYEDEIREFLGRNTKAGVETLIDYFGKKLGTKEEAALFQNTVLAITVSMKGTKYLRLRDVVPGGSKG